MNKKNLGLIALFILLIAAVVLLTAGETREEDAPLPDIRLTEIVPHSTQINADGYAMGSITLTSLPTRRRIWRAGGWPTASTR